ncbi:MAG: transposase [Pirellulaceae bacterium]
MEADPNRRNGRSRKTVQGNLGQLTNATPDDRDGTFPPQLIGKHPRRHKKDYRLVRPEFDVRCSMFDVRFLFGLRCPMSDVRFLFGLRCPMSDVRFLFGLRCSMSDVRCSSAYSAFNIRLSTFGFAPPSAIRWCPGPMRLMCAVPAADQPSADPWNCPGSV